MHRPRGVVLGLLALLLAGSVAQQLAAQTPKNTVYLPNITNGNAPAAVPGQYVITWKTDPRLAAVGTPTQPAIDLLDLSAMVASGENTSADALLASYRANPNVAAVEPNYIYTTDFTPNDPGRTQQWAWGRMQAFDAWNVTQGSPNVVVAVIDTGVQRNHPDLDAKIVPGYDMVDNDAAADDGNGHGTHVAGTVAAETNNAAGGAGTCPECKIMPIRALNNGGSGTLADIARGIVYATDNGAKVINMSLGGAGSTALQQAVDYAWNKGVFLACAAGNSNTNRRSFPAAYENCFAVASTTSTDARSSFSNYGDWVEAAAPGSAIYSTYTGSRYATLSGTSMAAPHVAGLAGLLAGQGLSNTAIRDRLCNSADRISGTGSVWRCGRINALRAVRNEGGPPPTNPTSVPNPTAAPSPTSVPNPTAAPSPTPVPNPQPGGGALRNGGFEEGTAGWTLSSPGLISTERPLSGSAAARLGGEDTSTDAIEQVVTVPQNGQLSYAWRPEGSNDMSDRLQLEIDVIGASSRFTIQLNATNGFWYRRTLDLRGFGGRQVRLRFSALTNTSSPTTFYLDEVSLR